MSRLRRDDGVAAVEAALLVPLLIFVLATSATLLSGMAAANDASRAASSGLRLATKVERNPDPDGTRGCGAWTRRSSTDEVRALVVAASGPLVSDVSQVAVSTSDPYSPTNLCRALSGSTVTVTVTYEQPIGRLGDAANALAGWFGGDPPFPDRTVTASAVGVLE